MAEKMFDEIKQEAYSRYDIKTKEIIESMMIKKNWTFDRAKRLFVIELDQYLVSGMYEHELKKLFEGQLNKKVHKIDYKVHPIAKIVVYVKE